MTCGSQLRCQTRLLVNAKQGEAGLNPKATGETSAGLHSVEEAVERERSEEVLEEEGIAGEASAEVIVRVVDLAEAEARIKSMVAVQRHGRYGGCDESSNIWPHFA